MTHLSGGSRLLHHSRGHQPADSSASPCRGRIHNFGDPGPPGLTPLIPPPGQVPLRSFAVQIDQRFQRVLTASEPRLLAWFLSRLSVDCHPKPLRGGVPSALPRAARTRRLQRRLGLSWRGAPQRGACLRGYGRSSPRPGRSPASGGSGSHPQYESVVLGEPTLLVAGARRVPTWWLRRAEPTVTALISPDPKPAKAQRVSIAVRCQTVLPRCLPRLARSGDNRKGTAHVEGS